MLFGAGGVTRTHDLLITKCIGALRLAVFRAFGAFPLGILREVRPILSIVFVRSFPRVGHSVGHDFFGISKSNFLKQKTPKIRRFQVFFGAAGRIRTADLILTKGDFAKNMNKIGI